MKLVWANETADDLQRLFDFLFEKSPNAAARVIEGILERSDLLLEFPVSGHLINDDSGRRELIIPFGARAYVLRYYIANDHIFIVRVWHSRETR